MDSRGRGNDRELDLELEVKKDAGMRPLSTETVELPYLDSRGRGNDMMKHSTFIHNSFMEGKI